MEYSLKKSQRLRGKQCFQNLLQDGHQMKAYPVALRYRWTPGATGQRIAVAVPRRKFKRAVDRNRLKRRLREAYRTQQALFPAEPGLDLLFIYLPRHELPYAPLEKAVAKLARALHNAGPPPAL